MKLIFSILSAAMDGGAGAVAGTCRGPSAMTRCECAELSFDEVARRLLDGASLEEVLERTGCGRLCTACLPDLRAHLARRR